MLTFSHCVYSALLSLVIRILSLSAAVHTLYATEVVTVNRAVHRHDVCRTPDTRFSHK